jgi:hypothetical protein
MARLGKSLSRARFAGILIVVFVTLAALVGYGVAQSSQVTQAEWAVYMVQGLGLDWNLPPQATANDYVARLLWSTSIEFPATRTLPGSSSSLTSDAADTSIGTDAPTAEALYRLSTVQEGDYNFRLSLAGGTAIFKVEDSVFEITQPEDDFRWVDLDRVSLDPGEHTVSVLLSEGARVQGLAIVPPCLRRIEPLGGWQPLEPLTFSELAVTLARALNLEYELPKLGPEIKLRGEEFEKVLELPVDDSVPESSDDPFWLTTGGNIVTARARFTVPEAGLYSVEARYLSSTPVRWVSNGCLKIVTCQLTGETGMHWTKVVTLDLEAGTHDLEITLPPKAALDQVVVQRRDPDIREYLNVVGDEGFRMGPANQVVRRREAVAATLHLRGRFDGKKELRCEDTLVAMEQAAFLRMAALRNDREHGVELVTGTGSVFPINDPGGASSGSQLFPKGDPGQTPVASPIVPLPAGE